MRWRGLGRLLGALGVALLCIAATGCARFASVAELGSVPAYSGSAYVELDGNVPTFTEADRARSTFEEYSELDALGRCTGAFALVGPETLPTEKRGAIGDVRPSGWQLSKYDFIDGKYLYNRCHLIAYALTAENANERNLITGTRYLNVQGMLPFEQQVAEYVRTTGGHVLYRARPVFEASELVARGVLLEAESVDDGGRAVRFRVYCYNVQPGVEIDYATGNNRADGSATGEAAGASDASAEGDDAAGGEAAGGEGGGAAVGDEAAGHAYVLNTNTMRFHAPDCSSVADIKAKNKRGFGGTREEAIAAGYKPCGLCKP